MNDIIKCAYAENNFTWSAERLATYDVDAELLAWKDLKLVHLKRKWHTDETFVIAPQKILYTDASGHAMGGLLMDETDTKQIGPDHYFTYGVDEAEAPIHCKEIWAILKTLWSVSEEVKNKSVVAYCDNVAVVEAYNRTGGRDLRLSRAVKELVIFAMQFNIYLTMKWVATTKQKADDVSRDMRPVEAKLRPELASLVMRYFNPTIDLYAKEQNRISPTIAFGSEYPSAKGAVIDGRTFQPRDNDRVYLYPPLKIRWTALKAAIPRARKGLMISTSIGSDPIWEQAMRDHFDYRVCIGTDRYPALLRPAKNRATFDFQTTYYTGYTNIKRTYLYIKGYSLKRINHFINGWLNASFIKEKGEMSQWVAHRLGRRKMRNSGNQRTALFRPEPLGTNGEKLTHLSHAKPKSRKRKRNEMGTRTKRFK